MSQKISEALTSATHFLDEHNNRDARRDANLLLAHVLNRDLTFLIAHNDEVLSIEENGRFHRLIERRASGQPLQYIIGKQEFYGLEFEVNESVLIPRPETEFLVEAALEILQAQENRFFCDVGTGSGCVAVSILKNLSQANAIALDVSAPALDVARRNAERNGVIERIDFYESNVFDVFKNSKLKIQNPKFGAIVSNPPYIPNIDRAMLQREVRDHEPHLALFSGEDGLDVIRQLQSEAPNFLQENGFLLFEIGFTQSKSIQELIDKRTWKLREIQADLQGIPRIVVLQKEC